VDEIEGEGWQRQWREITADRRSGSRAGREALDRNVRADARESKDTASAIHKSVVDLDERSDGGPSERHRSK
jgi:hypothetical protein